MVTEIRTVVTSGKVVLTGKRYERDFSNFENVLDFDFRGSSTGIYKCTHSSSCTSKIGALYYI